MPPSTNPDKRRTPPPYPYQGGAQRPGGIAILVFGGHYRPLIARRVREMNVYSEILPYDAYPLCFEELGHDLGMSA